MASDRRQPYLVCYAHEPEVEALKRLTKAAAPGSIITLRRWRSVGDYLLDADEPRPRIILNVGFAGRLNPEFTAGEVVLVARPSFAAARSFAEAKGIRQASLVTVSAPVLAGDQGAALRRRTGADIVDMEARHLFALADQLRLPFVSFKLISDNADGDAWDTIRRRRGEWSERLGAVVAHFLTEMGT